MRQGSVENWKDIFCFLWKIRCKRRRKSRHSFTVMPDQTKLIFYDSYKTSTSHHSTTYLTCPNAIQYYLLILKWETDKKMLTVAWCKSHLTCWKEREIHMRKWVIRPFLPPAHQKYENHTTHEITALQLKQSLVLMV